MYTIRPQNVNVQSKTIFFNRKLCVFALLFSYTIQYGNKRTYIVCIYFANEQSVAFGLFMRDYASCKSSLRFGFCIFDGYRGEFQSRV